MSYTTMAYIHSLKGQLDRVTILEENTINGVTHYIVEYRGVKCTAILNNYNFQIYVDDIYGIIKD